MLVFGVILVLIASMLRAWGGLNHLRGPASQSPIYSNKKVALSIAVGSTFLGIIGSILVWVGANNFFIGLVTFILFWFCSFIWINPLKSLGL